MKKETFNIEWKSKEGYGDFITGLCYAHSSTIKYDRPVHINFHWPNSKDCLLSDIDKEPIFYRFEHIRSWLKPVNNLSISHEFESIPPYRFINELEEFNPIHGLWYPSKTLPTEKNLVVFWTSLHNLEFPGAHKDPLYRDWDKIVEKLESQGYNIKEVTYRTPIEEAMRLIASCEFGLGYEGMIHQLFKFMWKPLIVASKRYSLSNLLCVQGKIIDSPEKLLNGNVLQLVEESRRKIEITLKKHQEYINDKQDPTKHKLYNTLIGVS